MVFYDWLLSGVPVLNANIISFHLYVEFTISEQKAKLIKIRYIVNGDKEEGALEKRGQKVQTSGYKINE